jgi:hypothetical protein
VWDIVTDFGDSAITLPLALLTLGFLAVSRQSRLAQAWVAAIGGAAVAIGVLKLGFGACGSRSGFPGILSPSGHTAISTAVYGSLAVLLGTVLPQHPRRLFHLGAALLVGSIAISRWVLHKHDAAEIAVGFAVGITAVAGFRALARREAVAFPLGRFALCALAIAAIMHGTRWRIEPAVHDAAGLFRLALPWCR